MMDFGYFRYGGMWMGMLIVILLVAALLYLLIRQVTPGANPPPSGDTPLEILKRRYARGEIRQQEFERIKKELEV